MQEIILRIRYFKIGLSKTFKKLTFFSFEKKNKVIKNKRGLKLMTSRSQVTKEVSLLVMYFTKFDRAVCSF